MNARQREIVARMAWIMLQGDRAMLEAEEIGAADDELAVLEDAGYVRAWKGGGRISTLPTKYELRGAGFYALVGV